MQAELVIALVVLLIGATTVAGLLWRRRQGRVSIAEGRHGSAADLVLTAPADSDFVLLQLSTTFCAPCKSTARILADVADRRSGVVHMKLDVAEHPALMRRFHVTQAPTTVILDREGTPRARFVGPPAPLDVERALDELLADQEDRRVDSH